jgi:hypothetical protein
VKKVELAEVISVEIEVVEVFHFEVLFPDERPSRMFARVERFNDWRFEGGGRTGPVGGHLASASEGTAKMKEICAVFIVIE